MADDSFAEETILIPGPDFNVHLAALDALHPIHYSRRLLIFRCASPAQRNAQLAALKEGLVNLLTCCPILEGIVTPPSIGEEGYGNPDWRTIEPHRGLELIKKDLRKTLPSFGELEARDFQSSRLPYDMLVPVPANLGNDRPYPACKVQLSAIEGGSILTWAMSHSVADGSGNNDLITVLSKEVRNAQAGSDMEQTAFVSSSTRKAEMGIDRSALRSLTSRVEFDYADHPGYAKAAVPTAASVASQQERPPHPFHPTSPESPVLLHIPAVGLAKLKADATSPNRGIPISTHDAIVALVWRTLLLIRRQRHATFAGQPDSDHQLPTKSTLFFPSDARRHLDLPSYIGNAVYQLSTSLPLDALLSAETGLQQAALAIRRTIKAVTPEKVHSYVAEVNKQWVDWAFMGMTPADVAMGTDWTSTSTYSDDWGEAFGGHVVRFRYPGEEGLVAVMPKLPDGSAEIVVSCMESEAKMLQGQECFGRYL